MKALGYIYIIGFLSLLFFSPDINAGDDKPKRKYPKPEDGLRRAVIKARQVKGQKYIRSFITTTDNTEDESYVVVSEFGTGDVGVFQGGEEEAQDQFIIIEKKDLKLIQEIINRQ